MTDWPRIESLALRYRAGDREAGSEAVRLMEPALRAIAIRWYSRHTSDREDWVQEARIAAWDALRHYEPGRCGIAAWVAGCVNRRLTTYMYWHNRASRAADAFSLDAEHEFEDGSVSTLHELLPDGSPAPEQATEAREALRAVMAWLRATLSPNEWRALAAWLDTHDGRRGSLRDVAEALGVRVKTADNLVNKARRKARMMSLWA